MSLDKMKNVVFPLLEDLKPSSSAKMRLKVKGSHPQSHMTLDHVDTRCHVKNFKCFISTSARTISMKIGSVVTYVEGLPLKRLLVTLIMWLSDAT